MTQAWVRYERWAWARCRRCGHRNRAHFVVNGLYLLCPQEQPQQQEEDSAFWTWAVVVACFVAVAALLMLAGPSWAWVP